MFQLYRMIQRIVENPKLLIALVVLLAFGLYVDFVLLDSSWNPLPDPDCVQKVSFVPGGPAEGDTPAEVDMDTYAEMYDCLDGSESTAYGHRGSQAGTLVVQCTDGTTWRVFLYDGGFVETDMGLFEPSGGGNCRRIASIVRRIKQHSPPQRSF